ncbi:hypothetical protein M9Y10_019568 [Tritrichomonas musculus]|uniref:Uncharacterized protein n=1 Tax=Tritrichomonas musculus TaxID=1915356 RepID=A0ABR2HGS5_9EUKA
MLILGVISLIQMRNIIYKDSSISLFAGKLICDDLQIHLDSNITLLCEDQFSYTIQYDSLFDFEIDVMNSINIINNSNFLYDQVNLASFKELFNTTSDIEITFKDFLNMSVIEAFINIFQSSYENIKLTMEWSKYVKDDSSYCQWDQSSILPIYDGIIDQYKQISESLLWSKVCINNQAYIVGVEYPGKIINISKMTTIIIVVSIIAFFIFVILSLYCIAKCKISRSIILAEFSTDESKNSKKSYSSKDFNRAFFKELLGIGTNAGSLIIEAISIFKTFQRMSATKTFSVHFSKDCYKMFSLFIFEL